MPARSTTTIVVDTTLQWCKQLPSAIPQALLDMFPVIHWLPRYSRKFIAGDIIAGVTIALVLVPQSLAYAKIAQLPVVYGLYSSFLGVLLYIFLGTSKDVTVGPTAVLSLMTGQAVVSLASLDIPSHVIATSIAFMAGIITFGLGFFRLGILLDFFPYSVLTGYTSGAAIIIMVSQLPALLGVSGVSSIDAVYLIIIHTLKGLPNAIWPDCVIGLSSMAVLLALQLVQKFWGKRHFLINFVGISRNAICVIIFTVITYLVNIGRDTSPISIIKDVPKGLPQPSLPALSSSLIIGVLPAAILSALAAVLEHIAIAKACARRFKYVINPNQELMTIGMANIAGSFFGAYTATGSFSRSAVNANSGVMSPLSNLISGAIVIFSLLFLTPLFYYIPNATLAAVIILAVTGLVAKPGVFVQLWRVNPLDFFSCIIAFLVTLFVSLEWGVISAISFSLIVLLVRIARPQVHVLAELQTRQSDSGSDRIVNTGIYVNYDNKRYQTNPPAPGVLLFRLQEALIFPNVEHVCQCIMDEVKCHTDPSSDAPPKLHWSDDTAVKVKKLRAKRDPIALEAGGGYPPLRAVILDFAAVNNLDSSGLQALFDLRRDMAEYAGVDESTFELHFVSVQQSVLRVLELAGITRPIQLIVQDEGNDDDRREPFLSVEAEHDSVHLTIEEAMRIVAAKLSNKYPHGDLLPRKSLSITSTMSTADELDSEKGAVLELEHVSANSSL
ncbi:uncharacterized protein VTP21DRAFT_8505 [Calcarisporiella thermophila]|uniref:uncharacterized protein n=1 Tax=Calcarisporiella thermophila TaxID=911321 RepID=UPI0037433965